MVILRCDAADGREFAAAVRKDARVTLGLLKLGHAELSIVLTDDSAIQALNRDFRGKNRPTDVLSFPQIDDTIVGADRSAASPIDAAAPPVALGDIVISIETARRQARALRESAPQRLRTLLIHGLLHLLGYDHERSPAEARRMFALARELSAQLAALPAARVSGKLGATRVPAALG